MKASRYHGDAVDKQMERDNEPQLKWDDNHTFCTASYATIFSLQVQILQGIWHWTASCTTDSSIKASGTAENRKEAMILAEQFVAEQLPDMLPPLHIIGTTQSLSVCGCKVQGKPIPTIESCPLHEHAQEMAELLQETSELMGEEDVTDIEVEEIPMLYLNRLRTLLEKIK